MKNDSKKLQTRQKNQYNWTQFDKSKAVAAYSVTGSYSKAAAVTGIPEMTIRYWGRQDWFAEELKRNDQAETEELKSVYTRIAKKAAIELEDRLETGDDVIDREGKVIQKRVAAKDLAIITGIAADQRRKQMDAPVSAPTQSSNEKLADLMREFIRFAKAKEVKDTSEGAEALPEPIEAQIIEENNEPEVDPNNDPVVPVESGSPS